ncbi:two pore domain potassium channel family protein [Candidatus Woesearchaeota archaeon]|nr:two pore domain potassium channel family protein [Candidatus Woesearchaeota archaeon]
MREKITIAIIVLLLMIGTFYLHYSENWSYVDSFYFSTITLTTVGYGDLYPSKDSTKIFVSIYAIVGISVMLYALGSIIGAHTIKQGENFHKLFSNIYESRYKGAAIHRRKLNRILTKSLIRKKNNVSTGENRGEQWLNLMHLGRKKL